MEEQELAMLKAELSIVRTAMKKIEKENESLREDNWKFTLEKHQLEDDLRRKITLQLRDEQLTNNQRKMHKLNNDSEVVSARFVLVNAIDDTTLEPEERLEKLKFFRDYFFDDFYSIGDDKAVEIVNEYYLMSPSMFVAAYALFSGKKTVFDRFINEIFENNSQLPVKIEILECVPPSWTLEHIDGALRVFLVTNKHKLYRYIAGVGERCASYLNRVMSKEDFDILLKTRTAVGERIIRSVVENRIEGFINERNLHLVSEEFLKLMFKEDYVNII